MSVGLLPFNLSLLVLTQKDLALLRPIKVLDIFDGLTKNFHPDGLFSIDIFGRIGDERRNRLFSYIDLRIPVFAPVVFKSITELKALYKDILSGKRYAVFNKQTKDFDAADQLTGRTGYAFFVEHFEEMQFEEKPSPKRENNIAFINKYRNNCLIDKFLVIPAGIRDFHVDANGKPSEDEINGLYRKILSFANIMENVHVKGNLEHLDATRYNIQLAIMEVYDYIKNMIEGKNQLILGKWASRKVFDSTRNVFTSYIPKTPRLGDPRTIGTNQTVVGLYQFMKATLPISIKKIRDGFLSNVFLGPNEHAVLVNKKTLKKEYVYLPPDYYDAWMTQEGLEKTITTFGEESLRHNYVEAQGYYIGLIYKPKNKPVYKLMQDIDELPENLDKKDVYPLTFAELMYLSVYKDADKVSNLVTRYPVDSFGSIYPSKCYLKSTVEPDSRYELDGNWEYTKDSPFAKEFPITNLQFFDSFSVGNHHIGRLGADFDGDTGSFTCLMTKEANEEIDKLLSSKEYYVGSDGKMIYSADTDVIKRVLASITG